MVRHSGNDFTLFIKSKIQFFESKSQLVGTTTNKWYRCLSSQRYNFLKANHNSWLHYNIFTKLFIKSKIQFFESKSQHKLKRSQFAQGCLSSQRYNFLKANHNAETARTTELLVVYQVKDTIFWKQITTSRTSFVVSTSCLSSQRYNFLKANHNNIQRWKRERTVVYQVKDTIFWKQITTLN